MSNLRKKKGFGLIEAIFGITIAATLIVTFTTLNLNTIKVSQANIRELKASLYAKELVEIGKDLEQSESGWDKISDLSEGSNCQKKFYPTVDNSDPSNPVWKINNPGIEKLDSGLYSRWIIVESVFRNQLSFPNEVSSVGCPCDCASEGVSDPDTKKITAKVLWNENGQLKNVILEAYLYNYR